MMINSRRRALIPAAVLALGLLITGCTNTSNGADAAIVGQTHITNEQLDAEYNEILTAQGKPANTADEAIVQQVLYSLVISDLLEQVAQDAGVTVTQGEIDRQRAALVTAAGGETALKDAYIKQNVAPGQIDQSIRFALLLPKVAAAVAPGAAEDEANNALRITVVAKSNAIDPVINPRYGTWSSADLQIVPDAGGLATPLPTATPTVATQ